MKFPAIKKINIGKREIAVIVAVLIIAVISVLVVRNSDGAQKGKRNSQSFLAMGSYVSVTCYGKYGKEACKAVKKELTHSEDTAKGAAMDKARETIKEAGVKSSLISMGENVLCIGDNPNGKDWRVGVKDLSGDKKMLGVLELTDKAVFSTADKERKVSVTVVSNTCATSDRVSAELVLLEADEAAKYWRENAGQEADFELIYIADGKLYITSGLKNTFSGDEDVNWIE